MSEDWINQITLNCLMNKQQYEKYLCSKINKQNNIDNKKLYSQRIIDLTKELLEEEIINVDNTTPDVNYAFENYIKTCIHYFKLKDNNELLQKQYKELDDSELEKEKEELDNSTEEIPPLNNSFMKKSIKICNANLNSFVHNSKKENLENQKKYNII
jgi:hypothetical protein